MPWTMEDFVRPDQPSKCTWHLGDDPDTSPHTKVPLTPPKKILPNILHHIGNTPLVRLNKIPQEDGIKCEMLVKCEFFNPGGSVKDRIGYRMVEDAEKSGALKPGYTIIEPTSGNTGIGLAMAAAVKGYRCIIVMPEKMSNEKVAVLRALGAEIIRTRTSAAFDEPDGLICVAQKLRSEIPNSIILDQYRNCGNPLAHYDGTAAEIVQQCGGKLDMVVLGAGTGGTVTGVGRKIKELVPKCKVIAVDPEGSILAQPESMNVSDVNFYELEGIGYDFIPTVLDRTVVDRWVKVNDVASFTMARRLIKGEGLLCGGSSGAAVASAIKFAKELREDQRCVVILPDSIRNYITKFVSDQWLEVRNLKPCVNEHNHWWWDDKVGKLNLGPAETVKSDATVSNVIKLLKEKGFNQFPVVAEDGTAPGVVTLTGLTNALVTAKVKTSDPVNKAMEKKFFKVKEDEKLCIVSDMFKTDSFILVVKSESGKEKPISIITPVDLLQYITENGKN